MRGRRLGARVGPALRARLPHGYRDAVLQVALWGLADLLYEGVRGIVTGRPEVAFANAQSVVSLERATGTFLEPKLQSLFASHHIIIDVSNWVYMNAQFTVNAVFLAFLYAYRNDIFYFVRNMFFVAMGLALVVHVTVPVAPPRMFGQLGFVDTVHTYAHINQDAGAVSLFVNPYAAVPSMHMCFALLVGISGIRLTRRLWLRVLLALYPLLVLFVIVVTANHFLFDALAGALTALVAVLVAQRVMARMRPASWSWGQVATAPSSVPGTADA
jgi:hypothetical protein